MDITQINQHIFDLTQELTRLRVSIEADNAALKASMKADLQIRNAQINKQHSLHLCQISLLLRHIKALQTLTYRPDFLPTKTGPVDSVSSVSNEV